MRVDLGTVEKFQYFLLVQEKMWSTYEGRLRDS